MKTAYIYIRVSTSDQANEGLSPEVQEKLCRRWAEDNDYTVLEVFRDEGRSGTKINRPGLQEMLSKCSDENHADIVLVQDTDRLARNTLDHLSIKALLKKNNVQLVSISQLMIDDSPEGNLIDTVIASVNAFQSQITGRKSKKVTDEKAAAGFYPGEAPLGYLNVDNPHPTGKLDKRIVVVDPVTSHHVKAIFDMYLNNTTVFEIEEYMENNGLKSKKGHKIHRSQIYRILTNLFYTGKFERVGVIYQGKHEPLISEEQFEKVHEILKVNYGTKTRKRTHSWLLNGFVFCADCKKRLTPEVQVKKSGLTYRLYSCRACGAGTYVAEDVLDAEVMKLFKDIEIDKSYVDRVLIMAKKVIEESRGNQDSEKKRLNGMKSQYTKAIQDAEDARFIEHSIDDERFRSITERYSVDIENVNKELMKLEKDYTQSITILEQVLEFVENIGKAYENAIFEEKRLYLSIFFRKIYIKNKKIVDFVLSDMVKPLVDKDEVRISNTWGTQCLLFRTLADLEYEFSL